MTPPGKFLLERCAQACFTPDGHGSLPAVGRFTLSGIQFLSDGRLITLGNTAVVWLAKALRP